MNNNTFIFNLEWYSVLLEYPAEVRFEVYEAIMRYASSGKLPELKPLAKMAFSFIKKEMDYNRDRYENTVEKRRIAGKSGAEAKKAKKVLANTVSAPAVGPSDEVARDHDEKEANADFAEQNKQSSAKEANADFAEQNKQSSANLANQAHNVNDNDNVNDNIFLERVRADVPEIRKAYLDQFFGEDKQASLVKLLKKWETSREELLEVCEEVLMDWTHKNMTHPSPEEAQSFFYNAVHYKYSILKSKQNGKTKNSGKTVGYDRKGNSGQAARNALDASQKPGFGLAD